MYSDLTRFFHSAETFTLLDMMKSTYGSQQNLSDICVQTAGIDCNKKIRPLITIFSIRIRGTPWQWQLSTCWQFTVASVLTRHSRIIINSLSTCWQLSKASALRWHRMMFITHSHFCYDIKYTAKEDTKFCKGGSNRTL